MGKVKDIGRKIERQVSRSADQYSNQISRSYNQIGKQLDRFGRQTEELGLYGYLKDALHPDIPEFPDIELPVQQLGRATDDEEAADISFGTGRRLALKKQRQADRRSKSATSLSVSTSSAGLNTTSTSGGVNT